MHRLRLFFILLLALILAGLSQAQDFLDPAQAFRPSVQALDARTLLLRVEVAPGYHLYRDKFRFSLPEGAGRLGPALYPPAVISQDPSFGAVPVYPRSVTIRLPVEPAAPGAPLALTVGLQGCAEAGLCYPPQTVELTAVMPGPAAAAGPAGTPMPPEALEPAAALAAVAPVAPAPDAAAAAPADRLAPARAADTALDESGRIAERLQGTSWALNLGLFFLAGLGLALTPCVFPMIPILSGIIAGQAAPLTRGRGLLLASAYVLGMALSYAAAGVAAGLSGTLLSAALQNPWVLGGFAAVFVLLSLSMFGLYPLQLPQALQSRLAVGAGRLQGGQLLGVFLMGAVSALIVGPCVAAPLAGALLYIGQTGNALLGGLALFALALGMGVPLLLVGVSAGTLLPRAGAWMEAVKQLFGVLLLATAVWLLAPVLPPALSMAAWALLLILPAMQLRALDPLPAQAGGWQRLGKGLGVVMLIAGAALLLGLLAGQRDPLQPLAGFGGAAGAARATPPKLPFAPLRSLEELPAQVRAAGRPVMIDVYADWCAACKEMERFTFADPGVQARLAGFTLLKVDVTAHSPADRALLKHFGLFGPPGILFLDAQGQEIRAARVVGFQDAPRFLQGLGEVCRHTAQPACTPPGRLNPAPSCAAGFSRSRPPRRPAGASGRPGAGRRPRGPAPRRRAATGRRPGARC